MRTDLKSAIFVFGSLFREVLCFDLGCAQYLRLKNAFRVDFFVLSCFGLYGELGGLAFICYFNKVSIDR